MTFTAKVVDTDAVDTANLPGGFIFVNRGLLDFVETESQLVGALAHEVGHIAGHHGLRELYEKVKQAALAKDKTMGQIVDRLGGPLATMRLLQYTRTDEVEAGRPGFYKYDPRRMESPGTAKPDGENQPPGRR